MEKAKTVDITFNETIIKKLPRTGIEYYDQFTRGREHRIVYRVVKMSFDKFCDVAYSPTGFRDEKLRDKITKQKLELPIIDIEKKSSLGKGKAVVANKAGVKTIPVLVFAKKNMQIDWWKRRKGIK